MGQAFINSIAIVFLSGLVSITTTWLWRQKTLAEKRAEKLADEHALLEEKVRTMEMQLGQVGQAIVPINAAFQAILIKQLTHFHTPEMDALMVKLGPPIILTPEEEERLIALLRQRAVELDGNIDELERDAARMLPMVMKRVKAEADAIASAPSQLKVVAVAPNDVVEEVSTEAPALQAVETKEAKE